MTATHSSEAHDTRLQSIIEAPIFIVGSPRSGTTWLQRLLLSHPAICGGQETHFFSTIGSAALRTFKAQESSSRKVGLPCYWTEAGLKAKIVEFWFDTVKDLVINAPEASYLLEKTPNHARYMDVIADALPKARFIHIIRDSRSVVSSLLAAKKAEWGKGWVPKSTKDSTLVWYLNVLEGRESGKKLPNTQYYELRYEDLKSDTYHELKKVFDYLAIPITDDKLSEIVSLQDFETQRKAGGSPLVAGNNATTKEPEGFFRKGEPDSWKNDLSLLDKLTVWRYTRKLMKACGYSDISIL